MNLAFFSFDTQHRYLIVVKLLSEILEIQKQLSSRGLTALLVTGSTTREERVETFSKFSHGTILIMPVQLAAGFYFPNIEDCVDVVITDTYKSYPVEHLFRPRPATVVAIEKCTKPEVSRIEELAAESGMTQYVAANNKCLERFAHLVIADCIRIVNRETPADSHIVYTPDVVASLSKHFGVEQ